MTLYVEARGTGRPLALLHGWAMNSDIWNGIAERLVLHGRIRLIDLPGHGRSSTCEDSMSLPATAAVIADHLDDASVLIGWSLGGIIALQIALDFPPRVQKLVLVSATARFVHSDDWPYGVDTMLLQQLHRDLHTDLRSTVSRFLALQALGSSAAREEIRLLQQQVFRHGNPDARALNDGLAILQTVDLRSQLANVTCPVLLINGEHDKLMPAAGACALQEMLPDARLTVIKGAGHAPFLSHPDAFHQALEAFL